MTQYMLSVIHDAETGPDWATDGDTAVADVFAAVDEFNQQLQRDGHWVFAGGLEPIGRARTARLGDGGRDAMIVDGPYLDSKEQLGGFWVVECDPSQIDDVARRAAVACRGDVELRPFQSEEE